MMVVGRIGDEVVFCTERPQGAHYTRRKKVKKTIDISPKNAFALFSGSSPKPDGLSEFLSRNIAA